MKELQWLKHESYSGSSRNEWFGKDHTIRTLLPLYHSIKLTWYMVISWFFPLHASFPTFLYTPCITSVQSYWHMLLSAYWFPYKGDLSRSCSGPHWGNITKSTVILLRHARNLAISQTGVHVRNAGDRLRFYWSTGNLGINVMSNIPSVNLY